MEMILLQAAGQNAGGGYSTIIMMVAIFVIIWLFMIRPQQKRQKELSLSSRSLKGYESVLIRALSSPQAKLPKLELSSLQLTVSSV